MRNALCTVVLAAGCAAQETQAPAAIGQWDVVDRAASRLGSFRSRLVAVSGLAELARVTCRHDRRRATSMLFQAFEILKKADSGGIRFPAPAALLRSSEECAPEVADLILRERPRFEQSFADQVQNARSAIGSEDESVCPCGADGGFHGSAARIAARVG